MTKTEQIKLSAKKVFYEDNEWIELEINGNKIILFETSEDKVHLSIRNNTNSVSVSSRTDGTLRINTFNHKLIDIIKDKTASLKVNNWGE